MDDPETLLLHTAATSHWTDLDSLASALGKRLPDLDLRVARTPPESRERIATAEIVIAPRVPGELLSAAEELRWIQALSSGVDFFDFETLDERGIALTNVAGVHAEPIAEQVLGYMLAFERGIVEGMRQQRRRVWERYEGGELRGKTLGVIGVGAIGTRAAELAQAFGMTVVGSKRDPETAPDAVDECFGPDGLHDLLARSDYVVVACPLTDETRDLLSYDELGTMGSDSVLINIARGPIVDEEALETALQQAIVGGAALDVFDSEPLSPDSPLWDLSNVIVTPHMAGSTPKKSARVADLFAENYAAYLEDGPDAMSTLVS